MLTLKFLFHAPFLRECVDSQDSLVRSVMQNVFFGGLQGYVLKIAGKWNRRMLFIGIQFL